jgi:DNA-binding NarL/FixJ family response regulator
MAVDERMVPTTDGGAGAAVPVALVDDRRMVVEGLVAAWAGEPAVRVVGVTHEPDDGACLVGRSGAEVVVVPDRFVAADGLAVVGEVLARHPGHPVVVLVSGITRDVVDRCRAAGAAGVVSATSSLDELTEAVRRVHRGETAFPNPPDEPGDRCGLSERELEVLRLVASGRPADEIAAELIVSRHTVRNHVRNILRKLGAHSKLEAVATAVRAGIIRLD